MSYKTLYETIRGNVSVGDFLHYESDGDQDPRIHVTMRLKDNQIYVWELLEGEGGGESSMVGSFEWTDKGNLKITHLVLCSGDEYRHGNDVFELKVDESGNILTTGVALKKKN